MSSKRINTRIRSATNIGVGKLDGYELKFHKVGRLDGSGKCNIVKTDVPNSEVIGVIFDINEKDKVALDKIEGLGKGYEEKRIVVLRLDNRKEVQVFTYFATHIDEAVTPFTWYLEHVVRGARENDFPEEYVSAVENIEAIVDPDKVRHEYEMSIYLSDSSSFLKFS